MADGVLQFSVESMVQNVLQRHGKRLAEEASLRRYEATRWLRKMVGVVLGKDLPAEPSEEDFRLGLRSGIILCNALNKVEPGAVSKIIGAPSGNVIIPNGALISSQYFDNVTSFLAKTEEMEIPTFQVADLEKGGESSRIVDCVLALKSYHEWKQCGGNGQWRFDGSSTCSMEHVQNNSDMFLGFMSRSLSSGDCLSSEENSHSGQMLGANEAGVSHNLRRLVREILADKNQEDIPMIVQHMLHEVMEEFEHQMVSQNKQGQIRTASQDKDVPDSDKASDIEVSTTSDSDENIVPNSSMTEEKEIERASQEDDVVSSSQKQVQPEENLKPVSCLEKKVYHGESKGHSLKCENLVERQEIKIQLLKNTLHSTKEEMHNLRMKYQEQVEDLGKHLNNLAHAASGYGKVLEENRKLYNQVQDLKGSIRVYCRVRPFLPGETNGSSVIDDIEDRTITLFTPSKHGKGKKSFTFNKVFGPSSNQGEVFADMQPLVRSVLDGYNVCIFAYGQTGSGKTYTMTGPKELTKETLGVNYRALHDLFQISEDRKYTFSYEISVQMIEIYNEQVRDLLVTDGANKKLEIRNNSANGINVPHANLVPVTTPSDVINLMNLGHKNRAVGSTNMNDRSSRSHSCLTVHVQGKDLTSSAVRRGCMHLVDLAGSERADKTDAVGDRLKEAQHINRSLSALGDVISSLALKHTHVPYRNSKLTQLLQDSLGGQAKTLMFVHISPDLDALGETLSTLKFAERVSTVELGAAKVNKENNDVKELKEQIAALKAALARKEGEETGSTRHSIGSSQDSWMVRSYGSSSPSIASSNYIGDACKTEEASNSTSRRHSLDSQDLYCNSPSSSARNSFEATKEEKSSTDSPDKKSIYVASKAWPEQSSDKVSKGRKHSLDNDLANTPHETNVNLDEMETTASDSSELDHHHQAQISRSTNTPNVAESRVARKPNTKLAKSHERSPVPQPQPTKRVSNRISPTSSKSGRQPTSGAARRKPVHRGK